MSASGTARIGISGWTYPPWRGVFYPNDLRQKDELRFAAQSFGTIEINGTFYGLQRPGSFAAWREQTPADFVFSVKAPRFITHVRRLRDAATPVANFLASGVLRLGPKLGPILWQLPPQLKFDAATMDAFFALLPHDTEQAAAMARGHDKRLDGRDWLEPDGAREMRHAVEIRHESFRDPAFIALLRKHLVALVCADRVEWPRLMDLTAGFVYCRLHGSEKLYASGYDDAALDGWAGRVRAWSEGAEPADAERVLPPLGKQARGRDVFVYFDNDLKVRAPADAASLAARLGIVRPGELAGAAERPRVSSKRRRS
jgi:uncharacterized protein YecE (DUF72 family)